MSAKKNLPKGKRQYTAAIIGAGRIASGFDTPKTREILTHAHAYKKHPRTRLIGFVDPDARARAIASKKWSVPSYATIQELCAVETPDIVSVCTPDKTHAQILRSLLAVSPTLVICEKPIVTDSALGASIVRAYERAGIPLAVNYSRRYDPDMQALRLDLAKGVHGRVLAVGGIYTKGLLHTGSHLIDLCRFLFGEAVDARGGRRVRDCTSDDPSVSAVLRFAHDIECHIAVADDRAYGVFELDIVCEKRRIRLTDYTFTMRTQTREEERRYKGFFGLGKETKKTTKLPRAMYSLVDNAVAHLVSRQPLLSPGRDALLTQDVCRRILEQTK